MASINYCFTVCRAVDEKNNQKHISNGRSPAIDVPQPSSSSTTGVNFFGRLFSFSLSPPASTSVIDNPLATKFSNHDDIL